MNLIDKYFKVGSDGFIALKDKMGSDESIEQAARISYGKGTRKKSETRGLIRYLISHRHTSPFEQAELQFHIRVSMDTWRQWIRHRTANVNEYSTRYSEAIDSQSCTDPKEWRLQSSNNKQGSSGLLENWPEGFKHEVFGQSGWAIVESDGGIIPSNRDETAGSYLSKKEKELHNLSRNVYEERINKYGIAREQARKDLPLSTYTEAYWKCDLHNLFHFMGLRCDSHAQLEIRQYSNIMAGIVKQLYPLSFEAWYDYAFTGVSLSRMDRQLLQTYMSAINTEEVKVEAERLGMSKREIDDFWKKILPADEQNFSLIGLEEYNHD